MVGTVLSDTHNTCTSNSHASHLTHISEPARPPSIRPPSIRPPSISLFRDPHISRDPHLRASSFHPVRPQFVFPAAAGSATLARLLPPGAPARIPRDPSFSAAALRQPPEKRCGSSVTRVSVAAALRQQPMFEVPNTKPISLPAR